MVWKKEYDLKRRNDPAFVAKEKERLALRYIKNKKEHNKKCLEYYYKNHSDILAKNKPKHKYRNIKTRFGITPEVYDALLESQNYKCAICCSVLTDKNKALDHCHTTGKLRAFLCRKCNSGIGMLQDSANLCKKASEYLERYIDKE